jgi:transcriptional regulator with XRE-family HTH domain
MTAIENGESFRRRRLSRGLSQGDAAQRAKINRSKLCLFERGSIELTEKELKRLDKAYGDPQIASLRGLLGDPDKPSSEPQRRKLGRQFADVSQTQLAKMTGISQTRLSRWEIGRATLKPEEERAINKALDEAIERASKTDPYRQALMSEEIAEELYKDRQVLKCALLRLEHSQSLDDPIVQEVIESLRRELAAVKSQEFVKKEGGQ